VKSHQSLKSDVDYSSPTAALKKVAHDSPTMRYGELWVLWTIVIAQFIPQTWAKKKPSFDAKKAAKVFDKKSYSKDFKLPFVEMAQELLKNDKFQGKLKKFLGEISKPKGVLTFAPSRWAFGRQTDTDLTPIQKNEVKEFIAMTMEPGFNKSVLRIAETVLNNKDVKQTMREVLNKMSIKVEDKRGNSKKSSKKSKPIKLTEDSTEYEG